MTDIEMRAYMSEYERMLIHFFCRLMKNNHFIFKVFGG